MGIRHATAVAALAVVLLLGGCAGTDSPSAPGGGSVTPSASPSDPSPPPSSPSPSPSFPEDLPTPSSTGKPSGGALTEVSGTVVQGVEPGCRLINQYLLLAGPGIKRDDLRIGATLTVRGRVEEGMMTTCQQGTPFVVSEIVSR